MANEIIGKCSWLPHGGHMRTNKDGSLCLFPLPFSVGHTCNENKTTVNKPLINNQRQPVFENTRGKGEKNETAAVQRLAASNHERRIDMQRNKHETQEI